LASRLSGGPTQKKKPVQPYVKSEKNIESKNQELKTEPTRTRVKKEPREEEPAFTPTRIVKKEVPPPKKLKKRQQLRQMALHGQTH